MTAGDAGGADRARRLAGRAPGVEDRAVGPDRRAEAAPAVPLPPHPTRSLRSGRRAASAPICAAVWRRRARHGRRAADGRASVVPLERPTAPPILVDRGWVPQSRRARDRAAAGRGDGGGLCPSGRAAGLFSATDDPATRHFYTLDPAAIGAALGLHRVWRRSCWWRSARRRRSCYPDPARHLPRPPNNHLSYAITWYGLAVALVVIFAVWASKVLRA